MSSYTYDKQFMNPSNRSVNFEKLKKQHLQIGRHEMEDHFMHWVTPIWSKFEGCFGNGHTMSYAQFVRFCRANSFFGDEESIFKQLKQRDVETLSLRDILDFRRRKEAEKRKAPMTIQQMLQLLRLKYSNLTRAWYALFDKSNLGYISYAMFCRACYEFGFEGDRFWAWKALKPFSPDRDPVISLQNFAPAEFNMLTKFATILL